MHWQIESEVDLGEDTLVVLRRERETAAAERLQARITSKGGLIPHRSREWRGVNLREVAKTIRDSLKKETLLRAEMVSMRRCPDDIHQCEVEIELDFERRGKQFAILTIDAQPRITRLRSTVQPWVDDFIEAAFFGREALEEVEILDIDGGTLPVYCGVDGLGLGWVAAWREPGAPLIQGPVFPHKLDWELSSFMSLREVGR